MSTTITIPAPASPAAADRPGIELPPDPEEIIHTLYLSSKSKQVINTIAFLMSMGAPPPVILDRTVFYPGGSYPLDTLEFTANGKTEPIDASLAAQMPAIALNNLITAGIIINQPKIPNVPIPSVTGTTPALAPGKPKPAAGPAASNSPVGAALDPTKRGIGAHFQLSFAWAFMPVGSIWKQSGEQFKLAGNIFSGAWWERTA